MALSARDCLSASVFERTATVTVYSGTLETLSLPIATTLPPPFCLLQFREISFPINCPQYLLLIAVLAAGPFLFEDIVGADCGKFRRVSLFVINIKAVSEYVGIVLGLVNAGLTEAERTRHWEGAKDSGD